MSLIHLAYGTAFSLVIWFLVVAAVTHDSRQKCEIVASFNTCAWELR